MIIANDRQPMIALFITALFVLVSVLIIFACLYVNAIVPLVLIKMIIITFSYSAARDTQL